MHSYYFRAVKNYKDAFQLIYATEMRRFDSCLYFYCVDNGIDPLTITVDPSRVPLIVAEGQSHVELPEELWDRTEQIKGYKKVTSSKNHQPSASIF